jgi:acyl transferase domain-containing protein
VQCLETGRLDLEATGHTLGSRRTALPTRTFAVIDDAAKLTQLASIVSRPRIAVADRKLTLIFTGQGVQWIGMGRELSHYPIFAHSLMKSQESLGSMKCEWVLMDAICGRKKIDMESAETSQVICTALQLALVDLLRSFGVVIDYVVGHSSGEISAA